MNSLLVEKILEAESQGDRGFLDAKGQIYSFLNPVSYLDALKHKKLFGQMDGLFADGSLLVAAIKLCYGTKVTRRSLDMTSIGKDVLEASTERGKSIYIVASRQKEVEQAVSVFKEKFPGVNIIGYRNGYFANEREQDEEARHITELNPDYLIVGMGIVKQELFLLKVKSAGYKGIGFSCGGFIHQTAANQVDYYPKWVDKANLRFLYRMYKEPHTRKRYLKAGIVFPVKFVMERIGITR